MKTYEYRGFDREGRPCRGLVEALSVKEARERLAAQGKLADRIAVAGRRMRLPAETRALVYRELGALLGSGMPMVHALDHLVRSPETASAGFLLAGVRDRIREGASLAAALAEGCDSVTPFETAVIQAAERSAAVDTMLEQLASFLEDQARLGSRIQAALIYPLIVLAAGICVAILMIGLLLPRTRALLAGSHVPLPLLTRVMVGLGAAASRWGLPLALGAAAAVWALRVRRRRDADAARRWDRRLLRLPIWGTGYALLVNLRFARTLAVLLQSGVPLIEGFVLAGRATGSAWVAQQAEREAESVRHGSSLSEAVRRIPPLDAVLTGWIEVGEASGGLVRLLESAGRRCQDRWERFVARRLALLEPVLILAVGGFVLFVTLSVLLPVISLSRAIGRP